jgi:hypothetical protein
MREAETSRLKKLAHCASESGSEWRVHRGRWYPAPQAHFTALSARWLVVRPSAGSGQPQAEARPEEKRCRRG